MVYPEQTIGKQRKQNCFQSCSSAYSHESKTPMSEPSFTSINLTSPDRLQGAICMRAILKCSTYLSILLVLLLGGLWQCWAELGRVASPTPCMVLSLCLDWFHLRCSFHRSTHCRKDHPELLPYFHISTKLITSPSTACGFERHQSRTYICRIWRGGRKARRSCERADRPRKTSALYFPLHPRRHIMSRGWRRVPPGGACQDITLDVSATSAGLQPDRPH